MFGIDPLYIAMILPVLLFSMWASVKVKSSFAKYSKIPASSGMTGKDTAEYILRANGLSSVKVVKASGFLSDHYDPKAKEVRLSPDVYNSNSIASIGVAAHETGHALQHAEKYSAFLRFFAQALSAACDDFLVQLYNLLGHNLLSFLNGVS